MSVPAIAERTGTPAAKSRVKSCHFSTNCTAQPADCIWCRGGFCTSVVDEEVDARARGRVQNLEIASESC
eukprot:3740021-Rhodomonas_salina.1